MLILGANDKFVKLPVSLTEDTPKHWIQTISILDEKDKKYLNILNMSKLVRKIEVDIADTRKSFIMIQSSYNCSIWLFIATWAICFHPSGGTIVRNWDIGLSIYIRRLFFHCQTLKATAEVFLSVFKRSI
jgi:hypothetical protein